jgi:hypothetical protein
MICTVRRKEKEAERGGLSPSHLTMRMYAKKSAKAIGETGDTGGNVMTGGEWCDRREML